MAIASHSARVFTMVTRVLVGTVAVVAIAAGTTACSPFGGILNQPQLSTEGNLANQKKVALETLHDYPHPDLESIKFTNEGSVNGAGTWAANAVLTVGGREYQEILGTFSSAGEGLPTAPPGSIPHRVTVIYSDGTSEELG